ncbi:hypothetical protein FraQA3DRAFT_3471 [Frankia sp. QA3]|nr:hypothetical protein FraQA3DRAFT_3471 [Frankia sp. QA3]
MARFLAAVAAGVALLVGGLVTLALMLPPAYSYLVPLVIILVVVGVNITAWLVIPRVVGSAFASASGAAEHSVSTHSAGGSFGFARAGFDWPSGDLTAEPNADEWSSCWDYAGRDGADDDRWSVPGGADNVSWSMSGGSEGGSGWSGWSGWSDGSGGTSSGGSDGSGGTSSGC